MRSDIVQVDNVVAKSIIFECKGDFMQQHVHNFDHMHLVGHGTVRVIVDGEPDTLYYAGDMIKIKAHKAHKIIAETDDAVSFCLHVLREDEIGELQEFGTVLV